MYIPIKWEYKVERIGDEKWCLKAKETFAQDVPEEVVDNTINLLKKAGIPVKKRKQTVYIEIVGTRDQVFSAIFGEIIGLTSVGDLTLRELVVLSAINQSTISHDEIK